MIKPIRILLGNDLERIKDYFRIYQFEAASKIVSNLLNESWFLDEKEKQTINDIDKILNGFIEWERFDHKKALVRFKNTNLLITKKQVKFLESLMINQNHIMAKLSTIYKNNREWRVPSIYLIADIFHNAKRSANQGKFDDAIARLYRCLEMVGQHLLLFEHDILSSNVNINKIKDKIPIEYYKKLERKINNEKQIIEVGLVDDFEILSHLDKDHPVSFQYLSNKDYFIKCLSYRNKSILAHGIVPSNKENYESIEKMVITILKALTTDIDNMLKDIESCFNSVVLQTFS